jgi:predicted NBD/HSP70 family sugar kinase
MCRLSPAERPEEPMPHSLDLPRFVPEQVADYQTDALITQPVCRFDPARAVAALGAERQVIAVDIGGDRIRAARYTTSDGALHRGGERALQSRGGAGYLSFLEGIAREAAAENLPVGISSATKMAGSVIARTVNLPIFRDEMRAAYGGDYARVFPGRSFVANDTITGICGTATLLALRGEAADHVGFIICASGMGGSVIASGTAIHVEVAHVPLAEALNPLGQATPCGVEGRDYVCVERVAAARAGIEDLWQQRTGEALDGRALGRLYEDGNALATLLYETSALALAHAIVGLAERYAFPDRDSTVVLHGGNFEIARYRDAVQRCLAGIPGPHPRLVFSRDLSPNTCLDGAAILGLLDPAPASAP